MKDKSESFKVTRKQVLGLGRVLETCTSERINDVQGFGWDDKPTFHAPDGKGFWMNRRVVRVWRQDQHKSEWD